jgi:hypothetical protein
MTDKKVSPELETQELPTQLTKKAVKKPSTIKRTGTSPEPQKADIAPAAPEETPSSTSLPAETEAPLENLQSVEDFRTEASGLLKQLDTITVDKFTAPLKLANDLANVQRLIAIRNYIWDCIGNTNTSRPAIKLYNPMVALLDKKIAGLLGSEEFASFLAES